MTQSSPIKTIFWDIGGVLLTNGWGRRQRAHTLTPLGVDIEDFESRYEAANFFWERGLSTALEFFNKTVFHADQPSRSFSYEELWPLVCAESKQLDPATYDILTALSASGRYKVATLNNESRELNDYRLDAFDLRRHFDYFICSGYVHEMKPNPDIYRAAIEISGLPPSTAVFVDDKPENCRAAAAFGIVPILFESPAQLTRDLEALGIQIN
ncbi:MAG: HAD-superfamily hydrolase, subfamily variant 3 [Acidobacteriaceae bacterium]|nr:HAD-superfamily hydrolase, subfamily variant 3 [Acidobacteriaceae bacterium]